MVLVEEANKDLAIFEMENALQEQAESFTNSLNKKDDEITKVLAKCLPACSYVCAYL